MGQVKTKLSQVCTEEGDDCIVMSWGKE